MSLTQPQLIASAPKPCAEGLEAGAPAGCASRGNCAPERPHASTAAMPGIKILEPGRARPGNEIGPRIREAVAASTHLARSGQAIDGTCPHTYSWRA